MWKKIIFKTILPLIVGNKIQLDGYIIGGEEFGEIEPIEITILNNNKINKIINSRVVSKIDNSSYKVKDINTQEEYILNNFEHHKTSEFMYLVIGTIVQGQGVCYKISNNILTVSLGLLISIANITIELNKQCSITDSSWIITKIFPSYWYMMKHIITNTTALIQTTKQFQINDAAIGKYNCCGHENGMFKYSEIIPPSPTYISSPKESPSYTSSHKSNSHKTSYYRFSKYGTCYRCGRDSHYADDCYASTDKYGRSL